MRPEYVFARCASDARTITGLRALGCMTREHVEALAVYWADRDAYDEEVATRCSR